MTRKANVSLPEWCRDEDTLRRLLQRRMEGLGLGEVLERCEVSRSAWTRLRSVANGHGRFAGDRAVAQAFCTVFDRIPVPGRARARFTAEEGRALAEEIGRWKILDSNGTPRRPGRAKR